MGSWLGYWGGLACAAPAAPCRRRASSRLRSCQRRPFPQPPRPLRGPRRAGLPAWLPPRTCSRGGRRPLPRAWRLRRGAAGVTGRPRAGPTAALGLPLLPLRRAVLPPRSPGCPGRPPAVDSHPHRAVVPVLRHSPGPVRGSPCRHPPSSEPLAGFLAGTAASPSYRVPFTPSFFHWFDLGEKPSLELKNLHSSYVAIVFFATFIALTTYQM